MMKTIFGLAVLALGMMIAAATANAGVVEVRFDNPAGNGGGANAGTLLPLALTSDVDPNTFSRGLNFLGAPFGPGDLEIEVRCGVIGQAGRCAVNQNAEGVGVRSPRDANNDVDNRRNDREFLAFLFSETVKLVGIDFEIRDLDDQAFLRAPLFVGAEEIDDALDIPGATGVCGGVDDVGGTGARIECEVRFAGVAGGGYDIGLGEWLRIGVPRRSNDTLDTFRVESLYVDVPVPEPASIALLGLGLIGLGLGHRRSRR